MHVFLFCLVENENYYYYCCFFRFLPKFMAFFAFGFLKGGVKSKIHWSETRLARKTYFILFTNDSRLFIGGFPAVS